METAREGEMLVKGTVGTGEGGIVCKNTLETQQESLEEQRQGESLVAAGDTCIHTHWQTL